MIWNYLKIAVRNLLKYRLYSAINLLGLSVGLAVVLLILLYLQLECSYDSWHPNKEQLYRIAIQVYRGEVQEEESHVFTPPIGPDMKAAFPEIKAYTRFSTQQPAYLSREGKALQVEGIHYADTSFFELFAFGGLEGGQRQVLARPKALVLTKPLAERLFGTENPLGKTVLLDNEQQLEVTGLVDAPPPNSHLQFEALISFSTLYQDTERFMGWHGGNQYITYLQLQKDADPVQLQAKFPPFLWRHVNEELESVGVQYKAYLQPLEDIHLWHNPYSASLRSNLAAFGGIGLLILFIAGVNFVNLALARASWRAKEVGMRKVLGARRPALILQFMGEAMLLAALALALAFFMGELLSPVYSGLIGKEFSVIGFFNGYSLLSIALLLLLLGGLAGGYPAWYISRWEAVKALKGGVQGPKKTGLRNALLVVQFAISAGLIASTLVIYQQLQYTQNKRLGFEQEGIIVLPLLGKELQSRYEILQQELLGLGDVEQVAALSQVPGQGLTRNGYFPDGQEESIMFHVIDVDEHFLEVFGLELLEGRFFSEGRAMDETAFLVNETLARQLNWDEPVGKAISRNGEHQVIGMVKDFHFASLHHPIGPLVITQQPWQGRYSQLAVKARSSDWGATLKAIRERWEKAVPPDAPFDYSFLDDAIAQQYESESRFQQFFLYFSLLSILIALMGILGLTALAIQQRTKEVGIRKVLGASVSSIIALFSKSFLQLVGIALLIGFPLAGYFMQRWLSGFAYHGGIPWWVFPLAGALTLLVAFLTVALRALRVAQGNPVEALRHE